MIYCEEYWSYFETAPGIYGFRLNLVNRLLTNDISCLWAVALYRLLIPFSVPSRFSIHTLANKLKTHFFPENEAITGMTRINTESLAASFGILPI